MNCASALLNGDIGVVPLVNEMDDTGWSALHKAAELHAKKCVELLVKQGARPDIKCKDQQARLPLELALYSRRMDVVWNPNDAIEDLVVCLREKDLTVVKLLAEKTKDILKVAYGCAVECRVVPLAALLMVAAEKVNTSALVPRHDTDLGCKDKITVYDCVIREALSLGWTGISSWRTKKRTAIWNQSENAERRKLLLCEIELLQQFGAVVQRSGCTDRRITSPLVRAAQAGDEAVIELLLKTDIDVNDVDAEGNSALHWSLKTNKDLCPQQIRIVCLLLKHDALVSLKNRLGLTALHIAAANGNKQALQILLSKDPDSIESTTEMLETPLFFAAKNDYLDCAQLLLHFGANTEVLNLRQRPIDLAKSQDMRFILSPTNISFTTQASQRKYTPWLQNDQILSGTREIIPPMTNKGTTVERVCTSPKTELCRFYGSPGGSLRGAKCYHAESKEELQQIRQDAHSIHSQAREKLKQKIFVGGLPPSLDSGSLGKFFEEQFGCVEEAIVINSQAGNPIQSRGFGFVTFKYEQSVSAALQAHYVTIKGKLVEIKSAVPKCLLISEFQKLSPRQQEEQQNNQSQTQAQSPDEEKTDKGRPKQMSLDDGLLCVQQNTHSYESEAHVTTFSVDQFLPDWVSIFKGWLPIFLQEVSKCLREGEWYPLSSLKADFRASCGLELDHASVGYHKLSDFMRSLPGICRMKIVPVGGRGPATHMVLLPSLQPNEELAKSITMPGTSCCTPFDDNTDYVFCDSYLEDGSSISYADFGFLEVGLDERKSFHNENFIHEAFEAKQYQYDALQWVHPRFLEFLKPDPLFHGRPWTMKQNNRDARGSDSERSGEVRCGKEGDAKGKKLKKQQRHLVLEALAIKRKSSSVFFLREFDFYDNYKASMEQGKCFACNQGKMSWTNFPCQHSLWCSDCKHLAVQAAAGTFEHKCVVCDSKVEEIIWNPWHDNPQQTGNVPSDEFPSFDPNQIQSSGKKKFPLHN
ncbi:uncharacterized protein LOC131147990 [Malania oleifera]|uniref:uncharacterized protein LOC131147990 n=1 Tax=Malania oleifera TaxID=397392 RepID=UPI0025AEA9F6|nr:uncharacterized protein LOC131147990 [Malania oleifera]